MILLLSNRKDVSCDIVEEYFILNKDQYYRINVEDILEPGFFLDINKKKIHLKKDEIFIKDIKIVWYRKFGHLRKLEFYKNLEKKIDVEFVNQLINEHYEILNAIISFFKNKKWITHPDAINLNKYTILSKAEQVGLTIPSSYIISTKKKLSELKTMNSEIISKSIFEAFFFEYKKNGFSMFTTTVDECDILELPDNFFPSFIQEKIEKDYEIRVFMIDNEFYSMAIMSQNDEVTKVDFRIINWNKPIRFIPYKLPFDIESKLINLCKSLNINCCSIDLLKSIDDKFVFLEINPVGEFGMVSIPCNYNLHEKIYKTLKKYNEN